MVGVTQRPTPSNQLFHVILRNSRNTQVTEAFYFAVAAANPQVTINNPNKFYVEDKIVYTTSRRFKNKGLFYMVKMMIKSWFNRNNDEFFTKEHNYWT